MNKSSSARIEFHLTHSKTIFMLAFEKKLAQKIGKSYSGFGKTPMSKTCGK